MAPIAHLSSGYVVYKVLTASTKTNGTLLLITALTGAMAPDIDGLFGNKLNNHRSTVFHTPLFWIACTFTVFVVAKLLNCTYLNPYISAFFLGVMTHHLLDLISGRTIGIRLFFPFSKRMFSLFPLKPEMGDIPVMPYKEIKKQIKFWQFYLENKFLIIMEIAVIASPLVIELIL